MRVLLLLVMLSSCSSSSFQRRLASMRAAEKKGRVGLALKTAYLAYSDKTGRGFTNRQLQDIADTVDIIWMPESWECKDDHKRLNGAPINKCSGESSFDSTSNRWTMKIAAGECIIDTPLVHEWLHVLRAETYMGGRDPGDRLHIDERVFEHPDTSAAPRFSAEWVAEKAFEEVVGCDRAQGAM